MKREYEATIEKGNGIFDTLVIKYSSESTSIFYGMNMTIHEVTSNFSINPANISSIKVTKEGCNRKIEIKYSKFNLSAITSISDKEQQIREILNLLGYPQEKIESIVSEKKHPSIDKSTEMVWIAKIHEHYDPDEGFSQRNHEINMSKKISKILGFDVKISMC